MEQVVVVAMGGSRDLGFRRAEKKKWVGGEGETDGMGISAPQFLCLPLLTFYFLSFPLCLYACNIVIIAEMLPAEAVSSVCKGGQLQARSSAAAEEEEGEEQRQQRQRRRRSAWDGAEQALFLGLRPRGGAPEQVK